MDQVVNHVANPGPNHVMRNGRPCLAPGNAVARMGGSAPKKAVEYRKAIEAAESPERVLGVLQRMHDLFMEKGDVAAGKVYLAYTLGAPLKTVEITGDIQAAVLTLSVGEAGEVAKLIREGVSPADAVAVYRALTVKPE